MKTLDSQGQPEAAQASQGQPEAARGSQGQPWAARTSRNHEKLEKNMKTCRVSDKSWETIGIH